MINNTVIGGRLTRDIELKQTNGGVSFANFTVAVERSFKNAQGERETDFINCVVWRKTAEIMSKYFGKGDPVIVIGSIQTRDYENNEGQRVYVTEIAVDNFRFPISPKKESGQQSHQSTASDNPFENIGQDDNPFQTQQQQVNDDVTDISDSDLPF